MKTKLLSILAVCSLLLSVQSGFAAETSAAGDELKALVAKVNAKLSEGKKTEADLAPELKEFDALLAKHKGEKTDEVAQIQLMEAMLYLQVLDGYRQRRRVDRAAQDRLPRHEAG